MHLLATQAERIDDGGAAVDLDQPPGDIVILSSADTELAALAAAASRLGTDGPSVRLASLLQLTHPFSIDLYVEKTLSRARLIVVRLMGGPSYWPYGLEQIRALARSTGIRVIVVPGEDRWDESLSAWSSEDAETQRLIWRYLSEGGPTNTENALRLMAHVLGWDGQPSEPQVMPRAGCYLPGKGIVSPDELARSWSPERQVAAVVFYRAVLLGGAAEPVDLLVAELRRQGLDAMPLFVSSLRDGPSAALIGEAFARREPAIVLNGTAFAVSSSGSGYRGTVLDRPGRPVIQVVFSGSSEEAWTGSSRGLLPRDLVMNVVLPELDGRLHSRAVSFKEQVVDSGTASRTVTYRARPDRVAFAAAMAAAWARLAATPVVSRRVALVLSNYPNQDGRIGNGVGLDTPASAVGLARAMTAAGYAVDGFPGSAAALMNRLLNDNSTSANIYITLDNYFCFLLKIPQAQRNAVLARWGRPEDDPHFADGRLRLRIHRFGEMVVGVQPARGYNIDPKASYHDPDLVPPHSYLAFYAWLRQEFDAHAVVHLGKHGNLEWLPGKSLGLSENCWPEIALGPTPLIYPFIVNDPGEGAQAKRRAGAVIVDHLMPALSRAELHGPLVELERLIDEYAQAAGSDARRAIVLEKEIVALAGRTGLDREFDLDGDLLGALDAHLCDLKELQIRDGLHVLGEAPNGRLRTDTLAAVARVPRAGDGPAHASLPRAIAADLELTGFDPLDCEMAAPWHGARPAALAEVCDDPWRTNGDTVERIEKLALRLIDGELSGDWPKAGPVLEWIRSELAPAIDRCGEAEIAAVLTALDGRFVAPGPSGAPSRGRPDVLPTGRNFYSVDTRAVPTPAAWDIGRRAAEAFVARYFQDEGDWPRSIALSAWGTSNMRTGGDDIAQMLALIGAKPVWEPASGRVTGFEVISLSELGRPRVDVTLKISGMFRDAFPQQIDLIDSAIRAVAARDEPDDANPLAATRRRAGAAFAGLVGTRIFGSKPGAYGAGLQALIDERGWTERKDFAGAFLAWGSFAYGSGLEGTPAADAFSELLASADAVLHNQDNREHDILDSDDYYQFQGGLAATIETLTGRMPRLYHGDHSRPEKPVVRALAEEIARVVRGRAANPKWIAGVMRHGYKGAVEMAATVDYLFAFAATTNAVKDHQFDLLYDAYIGDERVRAFIAEENPPALKEMAARFREAIDRELWRPAANSAYDRLSGLIRSAKTEVVP